MTHAAIHQKIAAIVSTMAANVSVELTTPKNKDNGDLSTNIALKLKNILQKNPIDIATDIVKKLKEADLFYVKEIVIAPPGFINFFVDTTVFNSIVDNIIAEGDTYGVKNKNNKSVLVEYVSANPTGPLHVGHARQGVLGDIISNLYQAEGWNVHREFYYNDAGNQIAKLALSVQARIQGFKPGDDKWPVDAYNGEYVADIAHKYDGDISDISNISSFAVEYLRNEQNVDLEKISIHFDQFFLESSLYKNGNVDSLINTLSTNNTVYEYDNALWLKTTEYGDDKDRVMKKSDGTYTYFVPDVAYHLTKFDRGFDKLINIQGSDHHGTIARVKAGIKASKPEIDVNNLEYVLHKMVTVVKDGKEVKISKRAGSYVTLRDLVDWTSSDAVRFFLASRKSDSEFTFDVDSAVAKNDENPVYYVQYAHARISSVIAKWSDDKCGHNVNLLSEPSETAIIKKLGEYSKMLSTAANKNSPHIVTTYLRELASLYHSYYAAVHILDGSENVSSRIALLKATAQVLKNGLTVLGISAPERMSK